MHVYIYIDMLDIQLKARHYAILLGHLLKVLEQLGRGRPSAHVLWHRIVLQGSFENDSLHNRAKDKLVRSIIR